jgi:ring-1,2-phenylacetyl-CoA epoxidase subunit PaaE
MFAEEIADLKDTYGSRFDIIHVLSREPREVELFTGRLDADRLRAIFDAVVPVADIDHFWLCGPYGMVTDAETVLGDLQIDKSRVHHELFFVDDVPPPMETHREPGVTGPSSEVTVVLDGRSTTATLPRDESILDAAEKYRSDLPFACKGGVCGTCRAKITCGDVDMRRNYALEDYEVDSGFVLTCQTFPVSDSVTVDFDA